MLNYYKSHFLVSEMQLLNATAAVGGSPVLTADRSTLKFFIRGHLIVQQVNIDGQFLEESLLSFRVLLQLESVAGGLIRTCHARHEATEAPSGSLA